LFDRMSWISFVDFPAIMMLVLPKPVSRSFYSILIHLFFDY
jgi:hypothetical protein